MLHALAAQLIVLVHAMFIGFVVFGGFLLLWRRWLMWPHALAALWGAAVSLGGWVCPLTPLENHLRAQAGLAGYQGGFIEHYLLPVIYPDGLTRDVQIALGVAVIVCNVFVYGWVLSRRRA